MQLDKNSPKMRIMAIDDSKLILEVVTHALSAEYNVYTYSSSSEAIADISVVQPDLILLDYEMPNINGLEVMRWIRENKLHKSIPVIFLTAFQDAQFEIEAFQLGAVDYINKPFTPQLLLKRIQVHLSHLQLNAELSAYNRNLEEVIKDKTAIIKELQNAIIFTLADLVEMRDHTTGGHIHRTTEFYKIILTQMREDNTYSDLMKGLDDSLLLEAVQLHDIGKISIPDNILLKPGKLSNEEYEIMKTHAEVGYRALLKAMKLTHSKELLNLAAIVALTHHEWWDGTGYPYALSGEAIPLIGRIMAIVDVYDAIVSERPYKLPMPHETAIKQIIDGKGTHFDPALIDIVVKVSDKLKSIISERE